MEEKKRKLLSENKTESSNPDNLTEKIKLLQKHQALQAEIERHKTQITEVTLVVTVLIHQITLFLLGLHQRKPSGDQEP